MRVFISWSEGRSKHIALSLNEWLPCVLQAVKPWMSATNIESGQRWQPEISKVLEECKFGIICVTPENQARPWLNFESGALSKAVGSETYVCPYLYDMEPRDLVGPLNQFQPRKVDKEGTQQLVSYINNRLDENQRLNQDQIEKVFEHWWQQFDTRVSKCPKVDKPTPPRRQEDILNEILENTRALRRGIDWGLVIGRTFKIGDKIEFMHWPGRVAKVTQFWDTDEAAKLFPRGVMGAKGPPYIDGVVEASFEGHDAYGGEYKEIAAGTSVELRV